MICRAFSRTFKVWSIPYGTDENTAFISSMTGFSFSAYRAFSFRFSVFAFFCRSFFAFSSASCSPMDFTASGPVFLKRLK
jgi:hypothetical protein